MLENTVETVCDRLLIMMVSAYTWNVLQISQREESRLKMKDSVLFFDRLINLPEYFFYSVFQ